MVEVVLGVYEVFREISRCFSTVSFVCIRGRVDLFGGVLLWFSFLVSVIRRFFRFCIRFFSMVLKLRIFYFCFFILR